MAELNQDEVKDIRNFIQKNFAQKPTINDRFIPGESPSHLGEKYILRDNFSRDADRILYSKAFRRLQHKAQVYSNKKGDHYRTRLTHTLEVTQISKSIARNIGIDIHLTEAIALGHDIGHTPFGHEGEKVLDNIMRGKDDLGGKLNFSIDYGGFKHNFNCLKILEIVEEKHDGEGLNLTWQTLDGILKHTSVIKENKKWDLKRFVRDYSNYDELICYNYYDEQDSPEYPFPLTLEGQVVAISDEIAQREHDLDDSLRDKELFGYNELYNEIDKMIKDIELELNSERSGWDLFQKLKKEISKLGKIDNELKWKELSSIIISYFIIDVSENTLLSFKDKKNLDIIKYGKFNRKFITQNIVDFSETASEFNDRIKKFIDKKIINSFNVNRFDGKSKFVLRQLFKAYYENPRQMPKNQLIILAKKIQKILKDIPELKEDFEDVSINFKELYQIDENYVDLNSLDTLLKHLKLDFYEDLRNEEFTNNEHSEEVDIEVKEYDFKILNTINFDISNFNQHDDLDTIFKILTEKIFYYVNSNEIEDIKRLDDKHIRNLLLSSKGSSELHYAYLSTICDYISQMTDDYAIKEYNELY